MAELSITRCGIILLLAGWLSGPARADETADRLQALERQLARTTQLIEQLGARVAGLERAVRGSAAAPAAAASAPTPAPARTIEEQGRALAALQRSVNQIADGLSQAPVNNGIPVHGFVDVNAGWSSGDDPVKLRGFNAGSLDLYLTPQIGPRIRSLMELVFEFEEEGSRFDMERVQLGYTFSDALTLWGGRFHTPFGMWNTAYHHGANLQPSITRPALVDFEDRGGLIPAHSVGLWATGKTALGEGRLTYDSYVANGPSIRERHLDPNTYTDDNSSKLVGFNLGLQPAGALPGPTFGLHGFTTLVDDASGGTTRLRALGGYLGYDAQNWELIGEYYRFSDVDIPTGARHVSHAGFLHVGRALGQLTPYLRLERASLDPRDNYFRSQRTGRSHSHVVLGARYALDANAALKFELRRTHESAATLLDAGGVPVDVPAASFRRALMQYSIAF